MIALFRVTTVQQVELNVTAHSYGGAVTTACMIEGCPERSIKTVELIRSVDDDKTPYVQVYGRAQRRPAPGGQPDGETLMHVFSGGPQQFEFARFSNKCEACGLPFTTGAHACPARNNAGGMKWCVGCQCYHHAEAKCIERR